MWSLLQNEPSGDVWPRLLALLIDSAAKGVLLMAAAALAAAAMRRNAAAARHLVWMLALGGLLLLPAASLMMPKWMLPILPPVEQVESPVAPSAPIVPMAAPSKPVEFAPSAPPVAVQALPTLPQPAQPIKAPPLEVAPAMQATPSIDYPFWIFAAYWSLALLSIAPFATGVLVVTRMRRKAPPFPDEATQSLAKSLGKSLGLQRPTRLLQGPGESMPMATGFLRAAVFLPTDATGWTEEKRRAVLLHELAHVKRRDCLTHAIARCAVALHWFNPLAWLALRQLRIEREHACDDLVLAAGERPSAYAENLLEIARTLHAKSVVSAAAITMAQKSQLEGRLLAVLDAARNRGRVTRSVLAVSTLFTICFLALISSVQVARPEANNDIAKNKDKANLNESSPQPEIADGNFSIEYPGGYRARIEGIGDSKGAFWLPDGTPIEGEPPGFGRTLTIHQPNAGTEERAFLLSIVQNGEDLDARIVSARWRLLTSGESSGAGTSAQVKALYFKAVHPIPRQQATADLELGVAAGPWTTAIEGGLDQDSTLGEYSLSVNSPYERDGATSITVTHNVPPEKDWRLVAVDRNDKPHTLTATGTSMSSIFTQNDFTLDALSQGDIKRLELQVRDFEWKKFDGIALNPNDTIKPVASASADVQNGNKASPSATLDRPGGDFSAEFPGGYRARVVGVGDSNGKPSETFWAADGVPLDKAPEGFQGEQSFVTPSSDSIGRMLFVELLPPPEHPSLSKVAFKCAIESPGSSGSESGSGTESFMRNTLGATWPVNIMEASIKVGLAAGPWTTVIRSCLGCNAGSSENSVIFSDAFVREGENRVIATHGHFDKDYRVVAVDASDIVYTLDRSGAGESGGMSQSEWILRGTAPEDVKALEIQTRNYEWKTISGIALNAKESSTAKSTENPKTLNQWSTSSGKTPPESASELPSLTSVAFSRPEKWRNRWWNLDGSEVFPKLPAGYEPSAKASLGLVAETSCNREFSLVLRGAEFEDIEVSVGAATDKTWFYPDSQELAAHLDAARPIELVLRAGSGDWTEVTALTSRKRLKTDEGTFEITDEHPTRPKPRWFLPDVPAKVLITLSYDFDPGWEIAIVAEDKDGNRSEVNTSLGNGGISSRTNGRARSQMVEMPLSQISRYIVLKRPVYEYNCGTVPPAPVAATEDTAKTLKESKNLEARNVSKPDPDELRKKADENHSVEFPGGYRAHLVSVRDAIGGFDSISWAGDGSPTEPAPTASGADDFPLSPETIRRKFYVELLPPPDIPAMTDVTFVCDFESPGSGKGSINSGSGATIGREFNASFPIRTQDASIKVGVAAGPWKTVFSACIGCDTGVSEDEFTATFSDVFERAGEKRVTASHKRIAQEQRVVAIDVAGAAHPLRFTSSVEDLETSQSEWIFHTVSHENVKSLEIQVRNYEWRNISGIALCPREKRWTMVSGDDVITN